MGIRPGFATARGGAANSGEPYHAQQRKENEGKQARRVRYPHVKLCWCGFSAERDAEVGFWQNRGGAGAGRRSSSREISVRAGPRSWKEGSMEFLVPRRSSCVSCSGGGTVGRPDHGGAAHLLRRREHGRRS